MSDSQSYFLHFPSHKSISGSDLNYTENAEGTLTLAAVTNRSPYTRFSTGGGGQLPGFDDGDPGQYRVNQALLESAIKYHGFSWQQELQGCF